MRRSFGYVVPELTPVRQDPGSQLDDTRREAPPADGNVLNLHGAVASGLAWKGLFVIVVQVTRTVSGVILVRLLQPSAFGLAGMAMLFSGLVLIFSDIGLGAALVQRKSITEADRSTAFWTTVTFGALCTLTAIALSGPIASFFHQPQVKNLLMVLSITFVLGSLGMTQASLIHRAMNFRLISIRLMVATVGGCATAIVVALAGGGAWSLIAQEIAVTILSTAFLWFTCDWRPKFVYSWRSLKDLGGFGSNVVGSNFLGFLQGNGDNILIGRYLGSSSLGVYSVAYNVILVPLTRLFGPVQETLFPVLSRIQDDSARVARVWLRAVQGVAAVIMPTILGLIVVAPDFVNVILGAQWHQAIPVIRILAVVTLVLGFSAVANRTLLALNRSRVVFLFAVANTALILPAFALGLHWGIVGVAALYTAVTIPLQAALVLTVIRVLNIGVLRFLHNVAGVTQAALLMMGVCWFSREGLIHLGVSAPARLAIVILIGVLTYLPATAWLSPGVIHEIRNLRSARSSFEKTDPSLLSS